MTDIAVGKDHAPSLNINCVTRYWDSYVKDKMVMTPSCLIHPGMQDKRRVPEIDLSQPRHGTSQWANDVTINRPN